jgi:single-strand DNA-binding protein
MAGYNRIIMVGNLTRDPDYKQLTSGQAVCRLGLASNRQFKNRQTGDTVQEVCFVDVDVWGAQADSCNQYLKKGRQVLVEGRIKFDTWEDPNGQTRSKHSIVADRIVFLSSQMESSVEEESKGQSEENQLEKELMDKIQQIKARPSSSYQPNIVQGAQLDPQVKGKAIDSKGSNVTDSGEIDFKDEPPFKDDLPF